MFYLSYVEKEKSQWYKNFDLKKYIIKYNCKI